MQTIYEIPLTRTAINNLVFISVAYRVICVVRVLGPQNRERSE